MFFSYNGLLHRFRIKKQNKKNKNNNFRCSISLRKKKGKKRTFYTSSGSYKNASLTVEAALVFPIFILAFWFMLYGLKITELQAKIQYALNVTAEEIGRNYEWFKRKFRQFRIRRLERKMEKIVDKTLLVNRHNSRSFVDPFEIRK